MSGLFRRFDDAEPNWECDHCGARHFVRQSYGEPEGCPDCHRHSLTKLHDEPIGEVIE